MKKHIKKFMALTLTAAILAGTGGIYAATRSTTTQSTESSATTDTALTANTSTTNTAAQTTDSSSTKGTYTSKTADQNAIWATGDITAKLSNVTVKKTGDSDGGDSTSFYGTNSGILASDGANLILNNIKVTTNSR